MPTAENTVLPEIAFIDNSQGDQERIGALLAVETLEAVPPVRETPGVTYAESAAPALEEVTDTTPNFGTRHSAAGVALLAGACLLASGCKGAGTETVDCTKINKHDSHKVSINPAHNPGKVEVITGTGTKVIGSFRMNTKTNRHANGTTSRSKWYDYKPSGGSWQSFTKKGTKTVNMNGFDVIGGGSTRPKVVCPE